jgi:excinuclease ABC subunit B
VRIPEVEEERPQAFMTVDDIEREVKSLEKQMREAAKALEFERAAALRDRIRELRSREFGPR